MEEKNLKVVVNPEMYLMGGYISKLEDYLELASYLVFPVEELGKAYIVVKTKEGILIKDTKGVR